MQVVEIFLLQNQFNEKISTMPLDIRPVLDVVVGGSHIEVQGYLLNHSLGPGSLVGNRANSGK